MFRTPCLVLCCGFFIVAQTRAQEVVIIRDAKPKYPKAQAVVPAEIHPEKAIAIQPAATKSAPVPAKSEVAPRPAKQDVDLARSVSAASKSPAPTIAKIDIAPKPAAKPATPAPDPIAQTVSFRGDSAFIKLADGFDFPIGKPDAQGYYKARGFRSRGHLGEDWDGVGGGDTDLGDPIYSIGDGVVVFARDVHMGWGNVLIVRHTYRDGGSVKNIDVLYGHLNSMLVHRGQTITRGQKIATMGNAHGLYDAHLHLEIRKNIEIGMSRAAFARDFSNYYDPSQFISAHRHLQTNGGTYRVALNTFTRDAKINFDKARNYTHSHSGGTGDSAAALKKALATQPH